MLRRILIFLALVLMLPLAAPAQDTAATDDELARIAADESDDFAVNGANVATDGVREPVRPGGGNSAG